MLRNMVRKLLKCDLACGVRFSNHPSCCFRIADMEPLGICYSFAERADCQCVLMLQCLPTIATHSDGAAGRAPERLAFSYKFGRIAIAAVVKNATYSSASTNRQRIFIVSSSQEFRVFDSALQVPLQLSRIK